MERYDYIIVGAGAAGPVIASRLSESADVSVLLLEAGGENTNDVSRAPGAFPLVWGTDYDWKYETTPQRQLNCRSMKVPRGRVIGGSTAINVGFWMRGTKEDYDSWEQQGAAGWNFDRALEMFRKIEDTDLGPSAYRGKGGMVRIEDSAFPTDFAYTLLEAFKEVGLGDIGDFMAEDSHRASIVQKDFVDNVRRTPADSYLSERVRARPNLTVRTDAFARRIMFRGDAATGVEVELDGKTVQIGAAREVIVSAGAINTPQLLMLSGIGPKRELERLGVPAVAEVPGVGENLRDHISLTMKFVAPEGYDIAHTHFDPKSEESLAEWRTFHTGPATYFVGPDAGLMTGDGSNGTPDFEVILQYVHNADGSEKEFASIADVARRSGYSVSLVLLVPESCGRVMLASSDPHEKPLIDPNYFDDPADMKRFISAIKRLETYASATDLIACTEYSHPALGASDEELEELVRAEATSVFHPVGTARIGDLEHDPLAVVDAHLRVRGVQNLRVADASIMPETPRGHTMSPTVCIGEMAAAIIGEEREGAI